MTDTLWFVSAFMFGWLSAAIYQRRISPRWVAVLLLIYVARIAMVSK